MQTPKCKSQLHFVQILQIYIYIFYFVKNCHEKAPSKGHSRAAYSLRFSKVAVASQVASGGVTMLVDGTSNKRAIRGASTSWLQDLEFVKATTLQD